MENVASASIEKVGIRKWVKFKCWVNCPFKKFSLIAANDELKYHLVDGQDSLCVCVYMTRICGGSGLTGSPLFRMFAHPNHVAQWTSAIVSGFLQGSELVMLLIIWQGGNSTSQWNGNIKA